MGDCSFMGIVCETPQNMSALSVLKHTKHFCMWYCGTEAIASPICAIANCISVLQHPVHKAEITPLIWGEAATAKFVIRKCVKYCDIETWFQIDYVVPVSCVLSVSPLLSPPRSCSRSASLSHSHTRTHWHTRCSIVSLIPCTRCERQIYALLHCGHNTKVMNGMLMNVLPHTSISRCTHTESHQDLPREYQPSQNHNNTLFQICIPLQASGCFFSTSSQAVAACFDLYFVVQKCKREWKISKNWPARAEWGKGGNNLLYTEAEAGPFLKASHELQFRVMLGTEKREIKGTEGVGRRVRGSQIKRLCLTILSRLSPAQPGSIDFVRGLERPTAADYLGEWAVLCKQTLRVGIVPVTTWLVGPWQTPDRLGDKHAHDVVHRAPSGCVVSSVLFTFHQTLCDFYHKYCYSLKFQSRGWMPFFRLCFDYNDALFFSTRLKIASKTEATVTKNVGMCTVAKAKRSQVEAYWGWSKSSN